MAKAVLRTPSPYCSVVCLMVLWVGCEPTPGDTPKPPAVAAEHADTLADRYARAAHSARQLETTAAGVEAHRRAATLALARYRRVPDPKLIETAREHLRSASLRRRLSGACEAALALARLEARHAEDPGAAYVEAYRTTVRFGRDPGHEECVEAARFMLGVLEPFRPSPSLLAPIDADPDHGDPSIIETPHDPVSSVSMAEGPVHLRELSVFAGAEAEAPSRSVRVLLRFDGAPLFRRGELAETADAPRQIYLQFENVRFDVDDVERATGAGVLPRVRAEREGDESRILFDVAPEATYRMFALREPERLVLDVQQPEPPAPSDDRPPPLVLLDPGHGGDDHGSRGPNGLTEAKLALDIARRVRAWLGRVAPTLRVRMTRDSDVLLSLEERAAMANALGAALFVSVHLNASSQPIDHGGVATFVLDVNNDRNVLRLAARENGTGTGAVSELQFLVGSLARAEQARASRAAARWIQQGALFGGRRFKPDLHDRGVRSAMFYVLVGAQMPAVLVEASFLTQPEEAAQLARAVYRDALAEGIARGVVKYLQSRASAG